MCGLSCLSAFSKEDAWWLRCMYTERPRPFTHYCNCLPLLGLSIVCILSCSFFFILSLMDLLCKTPEFRGVCWTKRRWFEKKTREKERSQECIDLSILSLASVDDHPPFSFIFSTSFTSFDRCVSPLLFLSSSCSSLRLDLQSDLLFFLSFFFLSLSGRSFSVRSLRPQGQAKPPLALFSSFSLFFFSWWFFFFSFSAVCFLSLSF